MNGVEIATAFNTVNEGKSWKAKSSQRTDRKTGAVDIVNFEQTNGMVTLSYDVEAGTFQVTFRKLQAAWKDYINAIARSLFVVLSSLKAGGLPFEAPHTLAGMRITTSILETADVVVAWCPATTPGEEPPVQYAAPEPVLWGEKAIQIPALAGLDAIDDEPRTDATCLFCGGVMGLLGTGIHAPSCPRN
jgi:hypothetical protein